MGQATSLEHESLSVFCGTWNLGNEQPSDLAWIPAKQYDIYCIGVQEAVYAKRPGYLDNEQDWFLTVHKAIGAKDYVVLAEQTLSPRTDKTFKTETSFVKAVGEGTAKTSGIRISLYIRKKLHKLVRGTEVLFQTCGRLNGKSGNKGGVCINIGLGALNVSFISSHLAAHREKEYLERRNKDFATIAAQLHPTDDVFGNAPPGALDVEVLNRHDLVFWLGDLNYRLDLQLGTKEAMWEEACTCIEEEAWEQLLEFDQLRAQQASGLAFHGFQEGTINWAPTFKLKKGVDVLATKKPQDRYNKKRVPAYCDRILWKGLPGVSVINEEYEAHPEDPMTSDHIPVHAVFHVDVPIPKKIDRRPSKKRSWQISFDQLRITPNMDHVPAMMEPDAPVTLRAFHPLAGPPVHTEPQPFDAAHWPDTLLLKTSAMPLHAKEHPFIFAVRHCEFSDPRSDLSRLGEGMLRWDTLDKSGLFSVPLCQRGRPYGTLAGRFQYTEIKGK